MKCPLWFYCCCLWSLFSVAHSFHPHFNTRRELLLQSVVAVLVPPPSSAEEEQSWIKPYAPLEQLLPAARVKWRIDRAVELSLRNSSATILDELQPLLFPPPNSILRATTSSNNNTNNNNKSRNKTPGQIYLNSYQRSREQAPLLAQPGAWLVQSGEIRAWNNLQRTEQYQETQNEIRAAFNTYTNALVFNADSYLLTAPPDIKKQLIRQDRLPDVTAVVTADLDLRYLYRNQVLTALDDARAEWLYQQDHELVNVHELVDILQQAQKACDQWFRFIDERDVQEVMAVVEMEER